MVYIQSSSDFAMTQTVSVKSPYLTSNTEVHWPRRVSIGNRCIPPEANYPVSELIVGNTYLTRSDKALNFAADTRNIARHDYLFAEADMCLDVSTASQIFNLLDKRFFSFPIS